jgi:hypothetical protein
MDFIKDNLSTIVVGAIVFSILGLALFRLIRNLRQGKTGCPCGCSGCGGRDKAKEEANCVTLRRKNHDSWA